MTAKIEVRAPFTIKDTDVLALGFNPWTERNQLVAAVATKWDLEDDIAQIIVSNVMRKAAK